MIAPSLCASACTRRLAGCLAGMALLVNGGVVVAQESEEEEDTDVVVFLDDNRLIGEVRGLERGKLSFNTDSTGTIAIEWLDVKQVVSRQRFEVSLANGDRYFGILVEPTQPGTMALDSGFEQRTLSLEDVVGLAEIEQTVLEGLELDLSLGYQYTNASDITQLVFGSDMRGRQRAALLAGQHRCQ